MNLLGILNRLQQSRWWVLVELASTSQRLGYPDYSIDVNRTMSDRFSASVNPASRSSVISGSVSRLESVLNENKIELQNSLWEDDSFRLIASTPGFWFTPAQTDDLE